MKALSIRQPWAWAILHAGKRVENREWKAPPRSMIGQTFLIHAAQGCTREEWKDAGHFMREVYARVPWAGPTMLPAIKDLTRGALVGTARLVDVVRVAGFVARPHAWYSSAPIRCRWCDRNAEDLPAECDKTDPWAVPGGLGLILDEVQALPKPIPLKGALGFFNVPDALLRAPTLPTSP